MESVAKRKDDSRNLLRTATLCILAIVLATIGAAVAGAMPGHNGDPGPVTISGRITLCGSPVDNVRVEGGGSATVTDPNGFYCLAVPNHEGITIVPSAAGLAFEPNFIAVNDETSRSGYADFSATQLHTIKGHLSATNGYACYFSVNAYNKANGSSNYSAALTCTLGSATFEIDNVPNGSYRVQACYSMWEVSPGYIDVQVADNDVANLSFWTPSASGGNTFNPSGKVALNDGSGLAGVDMQVQVPGSQALSGTITFANGYYQLCSVPTYGNYVVTPYKYGYTFYPPSLTVNSTAPVANFTASPVTYSISGRVTSVGTGLSGVTVSVTGTTWHATTNTAGAYTISGVPNGTWTVVASKAGWLCSPASRSVTISYANASGVNFTAQLDNH
jgi:hypothetical protein